MRFETIRERAAQRKGGDAVLQTLLGEASDPEKLKTIADDRILSIMAGRVFSAGFVWRVIENKWPDFEEAFLGFDVHALLFQPDEFWHALAADKRIVRNPQKIRSVRENALFVDRTAGEHGSFALFLAQWPADDQIGLMAHLGKHGSRLGGTPDSFFCAGLAGMRSSCRLMC